MPYPIVTEAQARLAQSFFSATYRHVRLHVGFIIPDEIMAIWTSRNEDYDSPSYESFMAEYGPRAKPRYIPDNIVEPLPLP
jgi:hypothetical protein